MIEAEMLVRILTQQKKTIATMESCTGGAIVDCITDVPGASEILQFSAVTYSNSFKVKMGVSEAVIATYSVYSANTAREMSRAISDFSECDYGVGVTGKINRADPHNLVGENNQIYISIYDRERDCYIEQTLVVKKQERSENKQLIVKETLQLLLRLLETKKR